MKDPARLNRLALDYGAKPAQPESPIIVLDVRFATENDRSEAKRLLAETRRNSLAFKDPLQQKRRVFRSKSKNEALSNPLNWKFTPQEKADTLDHVVQDIRSVGIVEALIDDEGVDVNVRRYQQSKDKGEYVASDNSKWLEDAAQQNDVKLVTLLASRATRQNAMDRALGIALGKGYMEAVRALLYYGANPNVHGQAFISLIQVRNIDALRIMLGAPQRMNSFWMDRGLIEAVKARSDETVALLLAHKADTNHEGAECVLLAVQGLDISILAGLIVNGFAGVLPQNLESAVGKVLAVPDPKTKHEILELLLCAGAPTQLPLLSAELTTGDLELVKLLIRHGVSPDLNAAESLCAAVRELDIKRFDELLKGNVSAESATRALECIPVQAPEDSFLRIVPELVGRGGSKQTLGQYLVHATKMKWPVCAATLVGLGASIDFEDAHAVRLALKASGMSFLEILLKGTSSPAILVKALPYAMAIPSTDLRRHAILLLVRKGVSGVELHIALQIAVSEPPNRKDERLIEELLKAGASIDFRNKNGNCVQTAVQAGDVQVLEKLCQWKTSASTLSQALPDAITFHLSKDSVLAERLLQVLLKHGAQGTPVAQGLVQAAIHDENLRVVELLLSNGADINYREGSAIEEALKVPGTSKLQLLCRNAGIGAETAKRLLPLVLNSQKLDMAKARIVVEACRRHESTLNQSLVDEVRDRASRREVIELLLEFGANVNFSDGEVLCHAANQGNAALLERILKANAEKSTLRRAMMAVLENDSSSRRPLVRQILATRMTGIGENEALVVECDEQIYSPDEVRWLLELGASVDFNDGLPLQKAIGRCCIPLLKALLARRPNEKSLEKALTSARETVCSAEDKFNIFCTILSSDAASRLNFSTPEVKTTLEAAVLEAIDYGASSYDLVSLLLKYVTYGNFMEESLLKAVSAPTGRQSTRTVQLLLDCGATANAMFGEPFLQAALMGNEEIMGVLAKKRPNLNVLAPRLIQNIKDDNKLIQALELCFKEVSSMAEPMSEAILFDALTCFPRSARLLVLLLENGCAADSKVRLELDPAAGDEDVTALIYALRNQLPESIVFALLQGGRGVDPGYVTTASKSSAIIEASRRGLSTVVEELIKIGAESSFKDATNRSPVFHASFNGHLETVRVLVQAGSPPNDGSLHEAARGAQPEIVSCLLAHGHDADYPCKLHDGRLAIEELCLKSKPTGRGWEARLRKVIEMLIPTEPKSLRQGDGKSFLHAALENEFPLAITEILVELPQVWRHLNDGTYDCQDANGYVYSPTQYIQRLLPCPSGDIKRQLIALFPRCQDRFYNPRGEQPVGAMGLPEQIAEVANRQSRARWELQEEIKRRDDLAAHQRKLTQQDHDLAMQLSKSQHEQTLAQTRDREMQEKQLEQQKHAAKLAHQRELNEDQHRSFTAEHRLRLQYQQEETRTRQAALATERAAELEHQRKAITQTEAADQNRAKSEMKMIDYKEQAMLREHKRQVLLIEKQDESVKLRSREMRLYSQATQSPTRQLTYDPD